MSHHGAIEIVDKEGWRKSFTLEKTITFVGSEPSNDIVLQSWRGGGVAPRQLQVIAIPGDGDRCRVVNLGSAHLTVTGTESRLIAPHSVGEITTGESIQFGDFSMILFSGSTAAQEDIQPMPAVAVSPPTAPLSDGDRPVAPATSPQLTPRLAADRTSQAIGLSLIMPQTDLVPDLPLSATIKVSNRGDETGVQFKIEVEGLDPEFYELGPAPILFPNAEREIAFQMYHPCGPGLTAGEHRFQVCVTAPQAYPGEVATASHTIHVLPHYEHRLKVRDLE